MAKVLLQLNDIHKRFGAQVILDGAGAAFQENQKIGVIGRNGAGKSTLCKIITGHEKADSGTITKSQDLRLSYLEQHDPYDLEETVIGFLMRYTGKEEWRCGEVAGRFQLKGPLLEARIAELSGGYRTRVKLTSMLLGDPNFLILDEPTNYLDLKTLILLEDFLQDWDGAFLVVSHDREFLKRTCEETLEVENGDMTLYPGSVEEYLTFKEEQKAQALSTNRNIEAKKKQLQLFVDRFRAKASKASQARSKMKQIQKLKTIEIGHALGNVHIKIPPVQVRGGIALRCDGLTIGYPEKTVARKINLEIDQGAHVAVLGDNGQGKTTFLRTIAGDLASKGGTFKWGNNLQVAYYAQHVSQSLHPGQDVFTHLYDKAAPGVTRQEIMNLAGSFLFRGEDTKKPIGVLSGGEKARVCLAGLLLTKSQVIILDEPTNHLDFETVEALGRALKSFSGTLFFVSHDRTFVNLVANQIIEVNNGAVLRYPGTYEDYVYYLSNRLQHDLHPELPLEEEEISAPAPAEEPAPAPVDPEKIKALEAERKKLSGRLKKSEKLLAEYRDEVGITEQDFADDPECRTPLRLKRQAFLAAAIEKEEKIRLETAEKLAELNKSLEKEAPHEV
ncbi:MAG TPA: ABC-F family ATP-binding cassette domain-containing protein [Candidatus Eisenbacteria bacterium]|nr:ABC-F family ATP-binding cassette domain-containing protein [Candidatus Eisenbacteria bacterium]